MKLFFVICGHRGQIRKYLGYDECVQWRYRYLHRILFHQQALGGLLKNLVHNSNNL